MMPDHISPFCLPDNSISVTTVLIFKMPFHSYDPSVMMPRKSQVLTSNQFYKMREKFVAKLTEYIETLLNPEDWVVVIFVSLLRNLASDILNLGRFSQHVDQFSQGFHVKLERIARAIEKAGEMLDGNEDLIHEAREVLYMVSVQVGRLRLRDASFGDRYANHMDERADVIDRHWQALGSSTRPRFAYRQRFLKGIWEDLHRVDVPTIQRSNTILHV